MMEQANDCWPYSSGLQFVAFHFIERKVKTIVTKIPSSKSSRHCMIHCEQANPDLVPNANGAEKCYEA